MAGALTTRKMNHGGRNKWRILFSVIELDRNLYRIINVRLLSTNEKHLLCFRELSMWIVKCGSFYTIEIHT